MTEEHADVVDQLLAARDLIADEERWCQGAIARDAEGNDTAAGNAAAVAFCAEGAALVVGSWKKMGPYLQTAANSLYDTVFFRVNDDLGHEAVMEVYDYAIRLAKDAGS